MRALRAILLLLLVAASPRREREPPVPSPYDRCDAALADARTAAIPETLLPAIARVESGRLDPATNRVRAWPWTINVEGTGSFFDTKQDAIAAVQANQARGVRSIDVGCMQINLLYHPTAFPDLDTAFDPAANATYAVRFLSALYAQTRNWPLATAMYHSQIQERGEEYQRRVFGRVLTPMGPPATPPMSPFLPSGTVFGAFPPPSSQFGAIPPDSSKFGAFGPAPLNPPAPRRR